MTDEPKLSSSDRLRAVRRSGLLDSAPDSDFDRLASLAARLLHAPSAFVTVIAEDRQYLKSAIEEGAAESRGGTSTSLDMSFCKHTVAAREPFIVTDARDHPLVKDNPAVPAGVIAYAGIPLETSEGEAIGALCVVDSHPRQWSEDDIATLRALARSAMKLIEERSAPADDEGDEDEATGLLDCVSQHLRATDFYAQLLDNPKTLDLGAEAAARDEVLRTLRGLRRAHATRRPGEHPDLVEAVARYLRSDDEREAAARDFAEGRIRLAELEEAIGVHLNAGDALRIAALNHGADL